MNKINEHRYKNTHHFSESARGLLSSFLRAFLEVEYVSVIFLAWENPLTRR